MSTRSRDVDAPAPMRQPDRVDGYFATVTVRLSSLQPEAVLAAPSSGVRGFWQSGSHWIAHAGSAHEIDGRERPLDSHDDPFRWVQKRADRLFERRWVTDLDGEHRPPRLHGGFAFDPARAAGASRGTRGEPGFWEAFPLARFTLPSFEVEADESGAWLTVTRTFPDDTPGDQAIDELRRRADRTREQLAELERLGAAPDAPPSATAIEESVGPEVWAAGIHRILAAIRDGEATKVVLARPLDVTFGQAPDSASVLAALRTANPLAHTYLVQFARDRFLLGASPELIGSLRDGLFRTMAVGGSTPRGADPESDEWLGRQLLGSRKDRVEHQIVVEDIVEHLRRVGLTVEEIPDPALLRLPRIQHLRTKLEAAVPQTMKTLELVHALHPTAAVCGHPRGAALEILTDQEPNDRGWYAGPVGWFDRAGEGEFAPALRCAVARGPLLRLYAGAGIVEGSRPRAEWDETRVKLQTMLAALGVARVP